MGEKFGVGFIKEFKDEVIYKNNSFKISHLGEVLVDFLNIVKIVN